MRWRQLRSRTNLASRCPVSGAPPGPRLGGTAGAPARPLSPGHGSPSQGRGSAALAGGRFVPRSARWAAPRPFCALRALSPRRKGRAPWLGRSGARRPPAAARPRQWAGAAPAPAPRLRRSALCAAGGPLLLPPPARRGPCGSGGARWGRWSPLRVSAGCGLPSLRSGRPCPPPPPRVAQPVPRRAPPGASASRLRGRRAPRGGALGAAAPPLFRARPPRAFCARVRPRPLRCQPGAPLRRRCRSVPLASPPAPSRPPPPLGAEEARDLRPPLRRGRGLPDPAAPRSARIAHSTARVKVKACAGGDLDTGREISDKRAKRGCRSSCLTASPQAGILILRGPYREARRPSPYVHGRQASTLKRVGALFLPPGYRRSKNARCAAIPRERNKTCVILLRWTNRAYTSLVVSSRPTASSQGRSRRSMQTSTPTGCRPNIHRICRSGLYIASGRLQFRQCQLGCICRSRSEAAGQRTRDARPLRRRAAQARWADRRLYRRGWYSDSTP